MKKGQELIGVVEYVNFPNKGMVFVKESDGEAGMSKLSGEEKEEADKEPKNCTQVCVKGVLPGQTVKFRLKKNSSGKKEGTLLAVITPSEREGRIPPCPHFGSCGGCTYQTMPYEEQLRLKEEQVKHLLREFLEDKTFWEGILKSPVEFAYRNKMEYSFGDEEKNGPLTLGMHKKGSFYDVVTTSQCKIVHEDFNLILNAVLKLAEEFGLTYYHKITHSGYLRHLLVRRAVKTGEILVHLVTTSHYGMDRENIYGGSGGELAGSLPGEEEEFLAALEHSIRVLPLVGSIKGILHIVNDRVADAILADSVEILYGEDFFYEELLGMKFKISTFSFFQTNSLGAEVLYGKVREYFGETKDMVVFDLYSGTGTIAQLLAPVARKVIGVEIVVDAVNAARDNAALNGLSNCEFIAGDVLKVLDTVQEKPDYIVLDPPRDGVHPKALERIIAYGVERMVYISCKPTSLARDLKVLCKAGYHVERVCMVDMFPGTVNVETICLLSKLNIEHHVEEELDMD
ncbi:MAG: 23S rRNA (uracil(1939)-C(5))-methyltransferase RlmD [Lachnospiraceae bacterium]|nr:23S rRNA (uracil(1939)-C(5))-methyltransferase RlmD [Lachnospiraceae bacterium]